VQKQGQTEPAWTQRAICRAPAVSWAAQREAFRCPRGRCGGLLRATDYRDVDGIIIPTTRRAYASEGDDQLVMVAIDMGEITIR
jgi:hypothetical protein